LLHRRGLIASTLNPRRPRILLLQSGFDFGIAVCLENGPVAGRFQPFAIGGAEPELDRQPAFAYLRVLLESKTLLKLDLPFR